MAEEKDMRNQSEHHEYEFLAGVAQIMGLFCPVLGFNFLSKTLSLPTLGLQLPAGKE